MHTLQNIPSSAKNPRNKLVLSAQISGSKDHETLNQSENSHIHHLIQSNQNKLKLNIGTRENVGSKVVQPMKKGQTIKNLFH